MPEITHIDTQPHTVPLKSALSWGKGHRLETLRHVLVRVTLDDGAQGIAEATPRPTIYGETPESVAAILSSELAPRLIGRTINSVDNIDTLDQELTLIKNNNTAKGAFNMALHAALAQSQDVSLRALLGVERETVTVSYIVGTGALDTVLVDVEAAYAAGVRVLKVKIGKDIPRELETITALQSEFLAARLYVDANQCLTPENAPDVLGQLAEMDVLYCEEPLPVRQLHDRQALRRQDILPIIADDSCFTLPDMQRELDFDTFDILNIKPPRTGFSQSRIMLQQTHRANKDVMVGSQASSLLGCLYAALFAGYTGVNRPSECTFYLKTEMDLDAAPPIVDGEISLADVASALR